MVCWLNRKVLSPHSKLNRVSLSMIFIPTNHFQSEELLETKINKKWFFKEKKLGTFHETLGKQVQDFKCNKSRSVYKAWESRDFLQHTPDCMLNDKSFQLHKWWKQVHRLESTRKEELIIEHLIRQCMFGSQKKKKKACFNTRQQYEKSYFQYDISSSK